MEGGGATGRQAKVVDSGVVGLEDGQGGIGCVREAVRVEVFRAQHGVRLGGGNGTVA